MVKFRGYANSTKGKNKPVKFMVISAPRSGSTFLRLSLNSHPFIRCHGEVFLKKYGAEDGFPSFLERIPTPYFFKIVRQRHYTDKFLEELYENPCFPAPWTDPNTYKCQPRLKKEEKAVGFKILYGQLRRYPYLFKWFKYNQVRVIHLIRENFLKTIASREINQKRKIPHSTVNLPKITIRLETGNLIKRLKNIENDINKYSKIIKELPSIEVTYEFFVKNTREQTEKIFKFLDIEKYSVLKSRIKKTEPDNLSEVIENYSEVVQVLKDTKFEKFTE